MNLGEQVMCTCGIGAIVQHLIQIRFRFLIFAGFQQDVAPIQKRLGIFRVVLQCLTQYLFSIRRPPGNKKRRDEPVAAVPILGISLCQFFEFLDGHCPLALGEQVSGMQMLVAPTRQSRDRPVRLFRLDHLTKLHLRHCQAQQSSRFLRIHFEGGMELRSGISPSLGQYIHLRQSQGRRHGLRSHVSGLLQNLLRTLRIISRQVEPRERHR